MNIKANQNGNTFEQSNNTRKNVIEGEKLAILIVSTLVIIASFILVRSFVVTNTETNNYVKDIKDDIPPSFNSPRLVFIVIDAFRLSFLTSPDSPMKFMRNSISSGNAVAFNAFARMPTVTLPRITAYITGTLPSFGSILMNFATDEITVDNWVSRMNNNQKKIHFYGDDTWIRLLPGQFEESEGVTSFFVKDYTEVDNNVTRHLNKELDELSEWDVLILHYLGLDHIGHSLGGTSTEIDRKLIEMDGIVERIHVEMEKKDLESYIIVCGDHGMTQGGSHGGSSKEETRVLVVIWNTKSKIGNGKSIDEDSMPKIEQIDVSATIFDLFGMEQPSESYGISFSQQLGRRQNLNKMYNHFDNFSKSRKLEGMRRLTCSNDNPCDFSKEFIQTTLLADFRRIQEELIETSANMPNIELGCSVGILIIALIISIRIWIDNHHIIDIPLFLINLICFASSLIEEEHEIWYFLCSSTILFRLLKCQYDALRGYKNKISIKYLLLLGICHRISYGWTQGTRRRWIMDQSLLPQPIFDDPFQLNLTDPNAFLSHYPIVVIILSFAITLPFLHNTTYLLIFSFISQLLRVYELDQSNALLLNVLRIIIFPLSFKHRSILSGLLCTIFSILPPSQLPLALLICSIGWLSSKLQLRNYDNLILIMSTFFYSGNSNSLSTISLTPAYVGLLDYYPIVVGLQLFLNIFSGQILFLCGRHLEGSSSSSFPSYFLSFRISFLATSLCCLYIFQHHLFVWSVYSPKVVYDLSLVIFALLTGLIL